MSLCNNYLKFNLHVVKGMDFLCFRVKWQLIFLINNWCERCSPLWVVLFPWQLVLGIRRKQTEHMESKSGRSTPPFPQLWFLPSGFCFAGLMMLCLKCFSLCSLNISPASLPALQYRSFFYCREYVFLLLFSSLPLSFDIFIAVYLGVILLV